MREYRVQIRDENGRWRDVKTNGLFTDLAKAKQRVTMCDEDGFWQAGFRIIADGFMYTTDDWRKEHRQ